MKSKAELFRQIGCSQELIEHFTICEETSNEAIEEIQTSSFFDSETAVIKFDVAPSSPNAMMKIN